VTVLLSAVYGVDQFVAFIGFVIVFDGLFILLLLRKLDAYRQAYQQAHSDGESSEDATIPTFDP